MGFFRRKSFTGSAFIAFATFFSIFSIFFFVALYLEVVASVSPYGLALDFLPLLGGIVVASLFTGRWVGRIGSRIPMTVGCLLAGSGVLLTYAAIGPGVDVSTLGWTMGLAGIGFGIVIVPVNATALSSLPAANSGMASSAVNTSRELGAVAGVAILGSIVNGQLTVNLTARLAQLGIPVSFRHLVITAVTTGQTQSAEAGLSPALRKQFAVLINKVVNAAYGALTHGLDIALVASAALLLVSGAVAYWTGTAEKLELVDVVEDAPEFAII
jgi:MFS family permease